MVNDEELLGQDDIEEAPIPADDAMAKIATLAERHRTLSKEIEALQSELGARTTELNGIEERDLPEAMQSIGMKSFTLADGFVIGLTRKVTASISSEWPQEVREAAFQWLRDNNAGDLIKRTVTLAFGKGEDESAQRLIDTAATLFPDHIPEDKQSVHAATLSAFVRTRMDEGLPVAEDTLGVFIRNYAKMSPPKAPRKKAK